ncbi:MAG: NAD(P)/FAD-dependent oxidoreductase [Candidatus Limiplasma sp.]|nr:NAD(P)/FAD-dependent oxidoreductase [Candidatus Limiplasma sp.]MEA5146616.1 NAD(P)/FAD-dependent oxidoreductase [Candidatus Limiplasma sp.]
MHTDILIIGGGLIGCAVARELSRLDVEVTLIERADDVAEGASKANSGIVHAGFDARPGSLKARFNVEGNRRFSQYCGEVHAPYVASGAMVLAFDTEQRQHLERLLHQGVQNGVRDLRIIEREQVLSLEPNTNPAVLCALYAPTSALASPYELTCALADHAAVNGVRFFMNTEAISIRPETQGFAVATNHAEIRCSWLVNCAGLFSADLHNQISSTKLDIKPRRGEYYLLDHEEKPAFSHTMFQTPTRMGKGVLISPTGHKTLLLGPSAQDVTDPLDVATTAEALAAVREKAALTWPGMSLRTNITTFAGIRAHEAGDDFIVGATAGVPGAYEAIGIESPGLTAAPAIADALYQQIRSENHLLPKAVWKPAPLRPKAFQAMSLTERAEACAQNPAYGNIVCRCEQVSEAEIRHAIRRPVGARNLDAVKRRTRAGMGRCQGGFCSPRVMEILAEELGVPMLSITKCGGDSRVLVSSIAPASKEDDQHA